MNVQFQNDLTQRKDSIDAKHEEDISDASVPHESNDNHTVQAGGHVGPLEHPHFVIAGGGQRITNRDNSNSSGWFELRIRDFKPYHVLFGIAIIAACCATVTVACWHLYLSSKSAS